MDDIVQRGVSSKGIGLGTGSGTVFGQEVCSGVLVTDVKVNIFSLFLHDVHIIPCHTISCHILLCYSIQYNTISHHIVFTSYLSYHINYQYIIFFSIVMFISSFLVIYPRFLSHCTPVLFSTNYFSIFLTYFR